MNRSIVALNITDGQVLLNKGAVPILLYTEDAKRSVENLFSFNLDIGNNLYKYIYDNFIAPGEVADINRYAGIKINCIFFDQQTSSHVSISKSLQEIHPINPQIDKELMSTLLEHFDELNKVGKDFNEYLDSIGLTNKNKETVINHFNELSK